MRAVRYRRFGPPDVLEVVEIPDPVPGAGEVLVRIAAASLNPLDWKIRAGHLRLLPILARPPRTPGCDLAGEIVAIGGGPGPRHQGERVFGSLSPFGSGGSCAEYAVIEAYRLAPVPTDLDYASAATLPIAAGTALQAFTEETVLRSGQRVLITGAAGGVGHFAVQLAKHLGAHVVATCGPANVAFLRELGADEVLDYTRSEVRDRSFDVVFDIAESLGWNAAAALLIRGGLYLGVGGTASAVASATLGSAVGPLVHGIRARVLLLKGGAASCRRLAELAVAGVLKPHIAAQVPLEGVADAQRRMETGHGRGKIVVVPHGTAA